MRHNIKPISHVLKVTLEQGYLQAFVAESREICLSHTFHVPSHPKDTYADGPRGIGRVTVKLGEAQINSIRSSRCLAPAEDDGSLLRGEGIVCVVSQQCAEQQASLSNRMTEIKDHIAAGFAKIEGQLCDLFIEVFRGFDGGKGGSAFGGESGPTDGSS
ncbi:hypothetical protein Acr_10g0010310 [Actinidia rufa]|uniref:Uncharacterized protein n=1 Tax=Actinidia rufa TaxID=165716 RepID=A0A7J0FB48_9ERIC|nr:hypothetical protein Acr_10g0010310 [Actinidia rufa]